MQHFVVDKDCIPETVVPNQVFRKIKAYDTNLMVAEVHFQDGAEGAEHTHPHEQISYCVEGEFDYFIEHKTYRMKKGDTIFVPKNLKHGCKLISQNGTLLDIFTPYREDFIQPKK